MTELKIFKQLEANALGKAYSILSKAGFDIEVIDGQMNVWYSYADIELDCEEGLCIVPEEYREDFDARQDEYYDEALELYVNGK